MKKLLLISLVLVILDQATKFFIDGTTNCGAAFGILQGFNVLFIVIGVLVAGVLLVYRKRLEGIGFYGGILLFSGVIGNLIDRVFLGYVRDFIDVGFWPSFNLADSYNTIGIFLLIIYIWKYENKQSKIKK
ncbi:MAG: signal peptidase II [Candidatus Woesearchaeota archaeon]